MALVLCIDLLVIICMIRAARHRLEDALPVLAFFLVLIPYESRLVIPGAFDLSTSRVGVLTLLALFLFRRERANLGRVPLRGLMTLCAVWALGSTLYSLSTSVSAKQLLAQVLDYYLLYYMFVSIVSDVRTIQKIAYGMVLALGLCCIFSMFEAYALWSILMVFPAKLWTTYGRYDPLYIEIGRGLRLRSTFPHPILFGDALAMGIPLALFLLTIWKKRSRQFVLWACLVLMMWAIYKTSSRGPWLAAGMGCILLFFFVKNRVRKYLTVIAVLAVLAMVTRPGIWQTIATMYESTQNPDSIVGASYEYRTVVMTAIREAVAKDPGRMLLGYGPGTFRELGLDIDFLGDVHRWYTCDNNWAMFLYENGYVGLLIIGALLFRPLWMSLRSYLYLPRPERNLSGVLFICIAGFYFLLMSVAGYAWGQQSFMAWILIALSVSYPRLAQRDLEQEAPAEAVPVEVTPFTESDFVIGQPMWGSEI
jgi:hypothetical protein